MNRALRAATVGVLLFSPLALSACSAGQVNQTASQVRDKTGPEAVVGALLLRQVQLAYPTAGSYSPGDDAELHMTIVNTGTDDDALVGITGTSFSQVRVTGSPSGTVTPAAPSGTNSATSTSSSSAATTSDVGRALDITVPADSSVFLGQNAPHVTLVGLGQGLTPAQTVALTFTFQKSGTVTMNVPVAVPASEVPATSSYNFHVPTEASEPGNKVGGGVPAQTSAHG